MSTDDRLLSPQGGEGWWPKTFALPMIKKETSMSKQKIARVCTIVPVNAPGKFDTNIRHFETGPWAISVDFGLGATITDEHGQQMFVPISNISSIDYE